jgi:hypothetical protein
MGHSILGWLCDWCLRGVHEVSSLSSSHHPKVAVVLFGVSPCILSRTSGGSLALSLFILLVWLLWKTSGCPLRVVNSLRKMCCFPEWEGEAHWHSSSQPSFCWCLRDIRGTICGKSKSKWECYLGRTTQYSIWSWAQSSAPSLLALTSCPLSQNITSVQMPPSLSSVAHLGLQRQVWLRMLETHWPSSPDFSSLILLPPGKCPLQSFNYSS